MTQPTKEELIQKSREKRENAINKNHRYISPGHIIVDEPKNSTHLFDSGIRNIDKEPEPFSLSEYYLG